MGKVLLTVIFSIIGAANADYGRYHLFRRGHHQYYREGWYICSQQSVMARNWIKLFFKFLLS